MATSHPSPTHDVRSTILAVGQRLISAKGFTGVGLNEILSEAGVPKGSFYHYFASKDAFGVALLESYFDDYLGEMDQVLALPGKTTAQRLQRYWQIWQDNQSFSDCQGKCLAVKLGAEVADMSETMRAALNRGTAGIISRLAAALAAGVTDGSLTITADPTALAHSLYQLWLGASIMVKISRTTQPFAMALEATRSLVHGTP
ncbi:TetR/AcrR family transcriptional regulator [Amantichitinum ursilacus]|uniref:HTH-type transcriptional repressor NemR n=1 Tax=Amantichitinum ursilacus TaxID=857265 RepID=A0A0N0XI03_9NEIS|nr:TetR/AcrR family transcriptional regulator [Amantichitinum ursilacus]KPC51917.1 HTH-type transcriptional repressor NemR [Amantichitinum ursilacus]